jgi:signal transduction histidine kinase
MTPCGGTPGEPHAAYAGSVQHLPSADAALGRVVAVARAAGRGLLTVLAGSDPAPAWRWAWLRVTTYAGLGLATLVLCSMNLANLVVYNGLFGSVFPRKQVMAGFLPDFQLLHLDWMIPGGPVVVSVLLALAVVAPLPLAARYPLLGWRLAWLGLLLMPMAEQSRPGQWPWDPSQILVVLVVFCTAGARHQRSTLWWMWAITLVPWWLQVQKGHPGLLAGVVGTVTLTAAAVASDALGAWRRARTALADQAERAELEQARRAVLEERARIARELHDVVAHHMSLIAVRAETAPYRLTGLPGPALAEFASLSGGAREALADMRKLLGLLRHDQPADLNLTPQPQLDDLPALIGTARRAGMGVHLSQPAAPSHIPPPVGVCAYRIVQESLSNASRHAPGAPVTVTIGHDNNTGAVTLRVTNGPTAPPGHTTQANGNRAATSGTPPANSTNSNSPPATTAPASPARDGHGHGLAGMRERVALLGGSLSAGPSPDGGFTVSAVLPLGAAA